jgi:phosphohistidine phosphatase
MELILWRHAEARLGEPDAERALTPKGRRHAARVGAWLDRQLPAHCRILSSPATRCVQTVEALGRRYAVCELLATGSSAENILEASGWPDARQPVLIVGHQPLLGQVAALILAADKQDWKIRKASVFWITRKPDSDDPPFVQLAVGPELIGKLR